MGICLIWCDVVSKKNRFGNYLLMCTYELLLGLEHCWTCWVYLMWILVLVDWIWTQTLKFLAVLSFVVRLTTFKLHLWIKHKYCSRLIALYASFNELFQSTLKKFLCLLFSYHPKCPQRINQLPENMCNINNSVPFREYYQ